MATYDEIFGGGLSNPFLPSRAASNPFLPRRSPSLLTPEQEEGMLGNLMEESLGGLAYLGKVLDKTFGRRAIGGILGGNPREALSVLPFSDTLGITREEDTIHGQDLLEQWGVTTPGDDSWDNVAAGIGLEIATDPATFVGAAVPRLVLKGLGGASRGLGSGLEAVSGINPHTFTGRQLNRVKTPINALFNPGVAGTWNPDVQQKLALEVFTPELNAGRQIAEENAAASLARISPFAQRGPQAEAELNWAMLQAAEGYVPAAEARLAAAGFTPLEIQEVIGEAVSIGNRGRATMPAERAEGLLSKEFDDLAPWQRAENEAAIAAGQPPPHTGQTQYVPRSLMPYEGGDVLARQEGDRLSGVGPFQIAREPAFGGIPGGTRTLEDWARDPRLSGSNRTFSDDQAANFFAKEILGQPTVPLHHPVFEQAKELSDWYRNLRPEAIDRGLFNPDLIGNVKARELESARTIASARTVQAVADKGFAKPVQELEQLGIPYVRVPDMLNRLAMTGVDQFGNPVMSSHFANILGLNVSVGGLKQLRDFGVPIDVAKDVERMGQAWKIPESVQPVVQMWDRVVNLFKSGLTTPFPAFHVRNLMSGIFNMWRAGDGPIGGLSPAAGASMYQMIRGGKVTDDVAAKLFPNMPPEQATAELTKELVANRIAFVRGGITSETVGAPPAVVGGMLPSQYPITGGAERPFAEDLGQFGRKLIGEGGDGTTWRRPFAIQGVMEGGDKFAPVAAGRAVGNTVEDWVRGTHYLGQRLMGKTPAEAKLSTMKYQIDYGELTQFEKNVMKRIFPWYTFSRRNLPPLLRDLAERPGKIAGATRVVTGSREPGEFVPPWVAEGASTPIPGAPEGSKRFISSFGLPIEDEAVKTLGAVAQGDPSRFFQQIFGMAQPFVKMPAEVATGTQMFSGRRLEDLRPYEFTTLGGLIPEDVARQTSQIIANTPLSRAASSIDKLIDERKGFGPSFFNLGTGVRITDVDLDKVKDAAARDLLQDMLRGEPNVRVRESVYVPKDQQQNLTPEQVMLFDLMQEIEKRQRERAKQAGR